MSLILSGDTGVPVTTVTGTLPVANGGTGVTTAIDYGFKNRLINGAMVIDQRNAGASVTPTVDATYTLDRWAARLSVASKYSVQQSAGAVTPPTGFIKYLGITSLSAYTVGASEYFAIEQNIEGLNMTDLGWGTASAATVTLSFWVRSSLTGTFGGSIFNHNGTRCYPFSYTISLANTWEQKSVTVVGDTSGTWLTTNSGFSTISFGVGAGATVSGTAGAWSSTLYRSATGATSVVGTNGATFYITGVQLEKGSTATSFDYRPYGTELALCQRYYEQIIAENRMLITSGYMSGVATHYQSQYYAVPKRASPTITIVGTWNVQVFGQPSVYAAGANGYAFSAVSSGTGSAAFCTPSTAAAGLTINAEL